MTDWNQFADTTPVGRPKWGFPRSYVHKESACNAQDLGEISGLGRSSETKKQQPIPVFFPGEYHAQKRLAGHSPWGHKNWI